MLWVHGRHIRHPIDPQHRHACRDPAHASDRRRPPVLVRQMRSGVVESVHRGDIVEVDAAGRMLHALGDPDRVVNLRSTVKPFGLARAAPRGRPAPSST